MTTMSFNLPLRPSSISSRNQASRDYFQNYTSAPSTEAINGPVPAPVRELTTPTDRLIVGVDFGTTFSGYACLSYFVIVESSNPEQESPLYIPARQTISKS